MKNLLILLVSALWTLGGCGHAAKRASVTHVVDHVAAPGPGYQYALSKAFEDLGAMDTREPSEAVAGINFQDLRRIRPGHFNVFVFPKLTTRADKSREDITPLFSSAADEAYSHLGKPLQYEVSIVVVSPCFQLIANNQFANLGAKQHFDASLAQPHSRQCAIIEVTSMKLKNANRALIRRDDLLMTRLFLDDSYNLYGYDIEKFVNGQRTEVRRIKTEAQVSTSGLTYFPVDIPAMAILQGSPAKQINVGEKVDKLAMRQIRKFSQAFAPTACLGREANYRDYFGSSVTVGWCQNLPFPQYMENSRFVAVTQPLSVR